ncbi:PhzF family phenazine biosynthesis protein [Mucilaginibacter myungsuensis]|uniref:PhzF family phenazine biosynthesis protein n=1 Tax=Mucilaginibacter myungsuensis TaxID=649104 RepID=A0A929KYB3_9SPHI|nr:PhzF family phenazine biosynthesis protein [Mucilaginibacter myungsuensis]MBE9662698.1 PhzF family phenazine biosynthesis protein [Mucilaginibacter myungsuensis]MDN3598118.1 PhzF family phenazine biosynthesis protein [Mucilaginibacter myungsuensis]
MTNTIHIKILNAFSNNHNGGNPAAIVLHADHLTNEEKQYIATQTGLSETAFVSASEKADRKLEFFTPNRQIAHCGHATIATFAYLKQVGQIKRNHATKETIDGTRSILYNNGQVFMEQMAPSFTDPYTADVNIIYASLGIKPSVVMSNPVLTYTGNTFLILEVDNENTLANLQPNMALITRISERYGLIGYYVFCRPDVGGIDATARMFAPAYGINEEAATGMAAGPLACYLFRQGLQKSSYLIEQGRLMAEPSPSLLTVNMVLDGDRITSLFAGGDAVLTGEMDIYLPNCNRSVA